MTLYNVVVVFDNFSITTTVESNDEDTAIENAISFLKDEIVADIESYNYIEVMGADQ